MDAQVARRRQAVAAGGEGIDDGGQGALLKRHGLRVARCRRREEASVPAQ